MKKLFIMALAALAIFTGCSKDSDEKNSQPVDTITVNLENNAIVLDPGDTFQLKFTTSPAKNAKIILSGVKPETATISDDYLLTAVSGGIYYATAIATSGDSKAEVVFKVTVSAKAESIEIVSGYEAVMLGIGKTDDLSDAFKVLPNAATNKILKYESATPTIVTIDADTGIATGIAAGTGRVRALATDGSGVTSSYITVLVSEDGTGENQLLDKTGWTASASSFTSAANNAAKAIDADESSFWWTHTISGRVPHWILIDMKTTQSFNKIDITRSANWAKTKTIEIWVSESTADGISNNDASFTKLGEVAFENDYTTELEVSRNFYPTAHEGRYIKLVMPDSFDTSTSAAISISNIDLYLIQ